MSALVFLPGLICLFFVIRGRSETAFLSVYLPTLLLLPAAYATRVPHLPPISISEAAVIPLGIAALFRFTRKGHVVPMDILVSLFMAGLAISEISREHIQNNGIFTALSYFIDIFLPYAIGRIMIEPRLRLATVRRIVIMTLFLGLPGIYSWRMQLNPYAPIGKIVFNVDMSSAVQVRSGRGRLEAAFSDAEIAGAAFGIIGALNAWLVFLRKRGLGAKLGARLDWLEKRHIPGLLLLLYVILTQSRGPMLGVAASFVVLQIPRFKNTRRATVVVGLILVLGTLGVNQYLSQYTDVAGPYAVKDEAQGSAVYRRTMMRVYQSVVEQGGWLGWGYGSIPKVKGLFEIHKGVQSVDDEFLYVHLAQGEFGYILILLIAAESIRSLAVRSWRRQEAEDRVFTLAMLGAMAILWITLTTVAMIEQLPQIAFLLIGWGQSIAPGFAKPATRPGIPEPTGLAFEGKCQ
jgi:hypothetical protein